MQLKKKLDTMEFESAELQAIKNALLLKFNAYHDDFYYSPINYETLLRHSLTISDLQLLQILLSPLTVDFLSKLGGQRFSVISDIANNKRETELYSLQFKLLLEQVRLGQEETALLILRWSLPTKLNLNRKLLIFEVKEMSPGATLLQICLKKNLIKLADELIQNGSNLDSVDYYFNTSLHYAAMGGKETFSFVVNKSTDNRKHKNIFNFSPDDIIENRHLEFQSHQYLLTAKFVHYLKKKGRATSVIYKSENGTSEITGQNIIDLLDDGICQGDNLFRTIHALRGGKSPLFMFKLFACIREWDMQTDKLSLPVNDQDVAKYFPFLKDVFEYLISVYVCGHRNFHKILGISDFDRVGQFNLLTDRNDKVILTSTMSTPFKDKDEFSRFLYEILTTHSFVTIILSNSGICQESHQVSLVVDDNNMLNYIDSNSKHSLPPQPISLESFRIVSNIMFAYYNEVSYVQRFEYQPDLCANTLGCK